jgi:hypothetical protein
MPACLFTNAISSTLPTRHLLCIHLPHPDSGVVCLSSCRIRRRYSHGHRRIA